MQEYPGEVVVTVRAHDSHSSVVQSSDLFAWDFLDLGVHSEVRGQLSTTIAIRFQPLRSLKTGLKSWI